MERSSQCGEELIDHRWVGAFNGVSAFNNSGMSLLDANMVRWMSAVPFGG